MIITIIFRFDNFILMILISSVHVFTGGFFFALQEFFYNFTTVLSATLSLPSKWKMMRESGIKPHIYF